MLYTKGSGLAMQMDMNATVFASVLGSNTTADGVGSNDGLVTTASMLGYEFARLTLVCIHCHDMDLSSIAKDSRIVASAFAQGYQI